MRPIGCFRPAGSQTDFQVREAGFQDRGDGAPAVGELFGGRVGLAAGSSGDFQRAIEGTYFGRGIGPTTMESRTIGGQSSVSKHSAPFWDMEKPAASSGAFHLNWDELCEAGGGGHAHEHSVKSSQTAYQSLMACGPISVAVSGESSVQKEEDVVFAPAAADEAGGARAADPGSGELIYPSLKRDGPSLSIGSERHPDGCKPCKWYCFSKVGCRNGAVCLHCHLYHPGSDRKKMAAIPGPTSAAPCGAERDHPRGTGVADTINHQMDLRVQPSFASTRFQQERRPEQNMHSSSGVPGRTNQCVRLDEFHGHAELSRAQTAALDRQLRLHRQLRLQREWQQQQKKRHQRKQNRKKQRQQQQQQQRQQDCRRQQARSEQPSHIDAMWCDSSGSPSRNAASTFTQRAGAFGRSSEPPKHPPNNPASGTAQGVVHSGRLQGDAHQTLDCLDSILVLLETLKVQKLALRYLLRRRGNTPALCLLHVHIENQWQAAQQLLVNHLEEGFVSF